MIYLNCFLIGGAICAFGELLRLTFKLTVGDVTSIFVSTGAFLSIGGLYDKLIDFAGVGALLPITNFGNSLAEAGYEGLLKDGILGLFKNIYSTTSLGISFAIIISFICALIFRPKS